MMSAMRDCRILHFLHDDFMKSTLSPSSVIVTDFLQDLRIDFGGAC